MRGDVHEIRLIRNSGFRKSSSSEHNAAGLLEMPSLGQLGYVGYVAVRQPPLKLGKAAITM